MKPLKAIWYAIVDALPLLLISVPSSLLLAGAALMLFGTLSPSVPLGLLTTPGEKLSLDARVGVTVSMGAISMLLTVFRYERRITYGFVEVAFACAATWRVLAGFSADGPSNTIALIGALYLMVRGWSNIVDGITALKPRPAR